LAFFITLLNRFNIIGHFGFPFLAQFTHMLILDRGRFLVPGLEIGRIAFCHLPAGTLGPLRLCHKTIQGRAKILVLLRQLSAGLIDQVTEGSNRLVERATLCLYLRRRILKTGCGRIPLFVSGTATASEDQRDTGDG